MVLLDTFWNSTEQQIFKIRPVELIYVSFQFMLAAYSSVGATGFTIYTYSVQWIRHGAHADDSNTAGPAMDWQKKQHLLDWNSSDLLRLVGEESMFFFNLFESPYMTPYPSFPTTPSVTGQRQEANGLGGDFGILALSEGRNMSLIPSESMLHRALKKNECIDWIDTQKSMLYCSTLILIFLFPPSNLNLLFFPFQNSGQLESRTPFDPSALRFPHPRRTSWSCVQNGHHSSAVWRLAFGFFALVLLLQFSAGWQRNKELTKFLSGLVPCLFLFPRQIQDSPTEVICCRSCLKDSDVLHSANSHVPGLSLRA